VSFGNLSGILGLGAPRVESRVNGIGKGWLLSSVLLVSSAKVVGAGDNVVAADGLDALSIELSVLVRNVLVQAVPPGPIECRPESGR